jgi:hypothetical protein
MIGMRLPAAFLVRRLAVNCGGCSRFFMAVIRVDVRDGNGVC